MAKFVAKSNILHDGTSYSRGQEITLDDARQADQLVAAGVVVDAKSKEARDLREESETAGTTVSGTSTPADADSPASEDKGAAQGDPGDPAPASGESTHVDDTDSAPSKSSKKK